MERRKFTREFKLEAVRLIRERGAAVTRASHDLGVHQSQLRDWVKKFADDPQHSFPGHGQMNRTYGARRIWHDPPVLRDARHARRTESATMPRPTCSTTSSASTIPGAGTRRSDTSVRWCSRSRCD